MNSVAYRVNPCLIFVLELKPWLGAKCGLTCALQQCMYALHMQINEIIQCIMLQHPRSRSNGHTDIANNLVIAVQYDIDVAINML